MAHYIPGTHYAQMNKTNIMLQPGGFRAVTGGPSIFGNGYGCSYGYGNYGCNTYGCVNADDGKLTFGQKATSFIKGIGNTIKGGIKNLFTVKGFLTTAACVAACFIPGVGPFIAAGLACIGIAKGAGTVIKGAQQASAATTDAEAMAAWENIGGGTFTVAASAVALKGAAGAIKVNTARAGLSTEGMTASQKLTTHLKGAEITYKNSGFSTKLSNTVGNLRTKGSNAYQTVRTKAYNAYNNFKNGGTQNQQTGLQVYNQAGTNANTAGTTVSSTWSKAQATASKAWSTATKYGKVAYNNLNAKTWTAKAGLSTQLDPEEANAQYGIYSYYV